MQLRVHEGVLLPWVFSTCWKETPSLPNFHRILYITYGKENPRDTRTIGENLIDLEPFQVAHL